MEVHFKNFKYKAIVIEVLNFYNMFVGSYVLFGMPIVPGKEVKGGVPPKLLPLNSGVNCTSLPPMPSSDIWEARPISSGQTIYVFGGSGFDLTKPLHKRRKAKVRTAFAMNITSGKWKQLQNMNEYRKTPGVVPINDNEILIAGDLKHCHL